MFTNNGGTVRLTGSSTEFINTSTAGNGTFTNNGGTVSDAYGGGTHFFNVASAGDATLIATGDESSNKGGSISFFTNSHGNRARVQLSGNGNLDISPHNTPGMAIGSIEGSGDVFLGGRKLTVGTNNLNTAFSGVIQDGGGGGGTGGSLTKTGVGKLNLTKASTYTGGTTITNGTLLVKIKPAPARAAVQCKSTSARSGARAKSTAR
jgi:autotransporter-associated beta strand protein